MANGAPTAIHVPLSVPPDRLAGLVGAMRQPAILESGPGFGAAGRWSLYAAEPRLDFVAFGPVWGDQLTEQHGQCIHEGGRDGDVLGGLARLLHRYGLDARYDPPGPDEPPFRGGLIGFYGYDLAPRIERLPRKAPRDSRLPDIGFGLYDTAITYDRRTGAVVLSAHDLLGEGEAALRGRIERWRDILAAPASRPAATRLDTPITSNFTRDAYLEAVGRTIEYIRAGDIFQVNLAQRFEARGQIEPLDLYLRLREISPAPFAAFLQRDDTAIVSASPEWYYRTRGDHIATRPIKGTRPRGRTPDEDARLVAELQASAKDRAELVMIVDLERNDLGRVCEYGSVRVTEPLTVESFAQVHHQVATIEGRLKAGVGPIEVVKAMFPGGSITGAPKIRAMEIIDELEPNRRGLYTGAIGYYSFGASGFNIPIRTLIAEGDRVNYHVGGGIVADSDPAAEYEETLHKGRGLRAVLEGAAS